MIKEPLVSIIIRTKNEEKTIGKLLDTLTRQTFNNFEIILVDDNSKDKTLDIVNGYTKKLPIRLIRIRPGSFTHPSSENLGADNSQGKYLCFLVGHTLPMTDSWLADGLKNFKNTNVAGISGHYTENPIGYYNRWLGRILFILEKRKRATFNPWLTNTCSLIRKDLWKSYPFNEKLAECEDYDWACEMLGRGYNIIKDPKFSVFHSHIYLGQRTNYVARHRRWEKIIKQINSQRQKKLKKQFAGPKIKSEKPLFPRLK